MQQFLNLIKALQREFHNVPSGQKYRHFSHRNPHLTRIHLFWRLPSWHLNVDGMSTWCSSSYSFDVRYFQQDRDFPFLEMALVVPPHFCFIRPISD